jgi:hypothetical protein
MWFDKSELRYKYKDFDNEEDLRKFQAETVLDNDDVIDITIEKYLSLPKNVQQNLYTFKSSGIHWEQKDVALDPYILGMWLGDGLSNGYGFVTADNELLEKWNEWGRTNDATVRKCGKYRYLLSSTINNTQLGIACNKTERAPLKKLLEKYDLVNNKHIPLDYLVNDRKTRLAVLAGLIDTDGNVRANGHEIRIPQGENNYRIIHDAEFLARSLGFSCHLNEGVCSYTVKGEKRRKPYKELTITGQNLYEIPTVLPRKKLNKFDNPVFEKRCSSFMQSSFKLIQKDVQKFVGWQVEGNGRFLLGDMSVVHNTPEGASVGLVKNMALSTHITINMSSAHVREVVQELGVSHYHDKLSPEEARAFLKQMGSLDSVHVMINGDLIGFTDKPDSVYKSLKHFKRRGIIPPTTSIVWEVQSSIINVNTEAGRMCRPLYIVDQENQFRMKTWIQGELKTPTFDLKRARELVKEYKFNEFIAPMSSEAEGFIEFLDVDEIDHAMIAMSMGDLQRGKKGTTMPPQFTHAEIHPSLMNGVLAANIPFSDHNQSPRNCYQCLWEEEPVWMADGTRKMIKDVKVGDAVVSFHPESMMLSTTQVVHQYVRPAEKPVYKVVTDSGRVIVATNDHKFMTNEGWKEVRAFIPNATKLGVLPRTLDVNVSGQLHRPVQIILNTTGIPTMDQRLRDMELLPLWNNSDKILSIARIIGFMKARGIRPRFASEMDAMSYENDVYALGFTEYGSQDNGFLVLMEALGGDIRTKLPAWLDECSAKAQVEFAAAYLGGEGSFQLADPVLKWVNMTKEDVGVRFNYMKNMEYAKKMEYQGYVKYEKSNGKKEVATFEDWSANVETKGPLLFVAVGDLLPMRNCMISDITVESDNHSFFGGEGFAVSNSAMGKQAVGVYMSNFNYRIDTMAHVLNYPQKPIVQTKLSKYTYADQLPSGINAVVAIMTYTG